jgi:outer membrane murein-binding lipoprotein Lpp
MYLNSLYKKFTIVGLSILLVFIIGANGNQVHAQKVNLKQKIASIKWPSILKGKRISLDDSLNVKVASQPKVKKSKLQAPPKETKVKKEKTKPQAKVKKLKPQSSTVSNRIEIKLPKFGPFFKKQFAQLRSTKKKDTSIRIGRVALKRLKQNKIDQLSTNVIDIETQIQQLQSQKASIEKRIDLLATPDSVKAHLRKEIIDYKTASQAEMPIPVGNSDIDELVRNLVLLDKIPSNTNLTIRPYYTETKLNYQSLLQAIDSSIVYDPLLFKNRFFTLKKLPLQIGQKYNSLHPYGGNDGAMSYSTGYQFQISGGIFAQFKNLKLQLRPEYVQTASEKYKLNSYWGQVNPAYKKLLLGNSSLRFDLGKLSMGVSTQNLWWGPGIYNSLLMSNNAQGFFHYSINSNRPIKNFLGTFQFQVISATLKQDSLQGFENKGLRRMAINKSDRVLSSLAVDYQPSFLKNISFGVNRSLQSYKDRLPTDFVQKNIPVLGAFFGSTDVARDTFPQDQQVSIYTKWMFPKSHAELYYQFAYNDAKANWRDFWLDMSHSTAYILGFKKLFILKNDKYLDLGMEVIKLGQTPSYLHRNAGNFYEHAQILEGYTNQNQIMGAGSGFGNNMQTLQLSLNEGWNKFGFIFHHIQQNPMALVSGVYDLGLRKTKWDDYSYGLQSRFKYKNILFNANIEWVNSKNYLWTKGQNQNNLYANFNTIFLW